MASMSAPAQLENAVLQARMTPAKNPDYIDPKDLTFGKSKFHSRIFLIAGDGTPDDSEAYANLMNEMFPYDPASNKQLNPMGAAVSKNWTKNGDLLVHVEWIELHPEEGGDTADEKDY